MTKKQNREATPVRPPIQTFTDPHNRPCVRVPLKRQGTIWATVLEADYRRINESDEFADTWHVNGNGRGRDGELAQERKYVRVHRRRERLKLATVSRLILRAGYGQIVEMIGTDWTDLRPENWRIVPGKRGKAKR